MIVRTAVPLHPPGWEFATGGHFTVRESPSADASRRPGVGAVTTGSPRTLDDSVHDRLLHERIVVLGQEVDDAVAGRVVAQLLLLAAEDPTRDITLYVNSTGGSVTAGLAVYDTMHAIEPDVSTVATGLAAGPRCCTGSSVRSPRSPPGTAGRASSRSRPTSTATAGSPPPRRPRTG